MKNVLFFTMALVLSQVSQAQISTSESLTLCGPGGLAMFDSENVFDCKVTLNTCQTNDLKQKGWLTTATGTCPRPDRPLDRPCDDSFEQKMVNPATPSETLIVRNHCALERIMEMGWVFAAE